MRIDKYLWHIRIFKSRNLATEYCKKNRIKVGEIIVKPSRELKIDEIITIRKNQFNYTIKVLDFPKSRVSAKLVSIYCTDITPIEELEKFKLIRESQAYYRQKGLGRPTKKDRREIEDFFDENDEDE